MAMATKIEVTGNKTPVDMTGKTGKEVTTVETVTPNKAAKWLEANLHNRKVSDNIVAGYARDMEAGRWGFSNDAICFDIDGILINGQHRLHACVLAATPFKALVIRGMSKQAQEIMDGGKPRRVTDILRLRGYKYDTVLAAALRSLVDIANASEYYRAVRPTSKESLALLEKHPGLADSVAYVHGGGTMPKAISRSMLSALHYIGKHLLKEPQKADAFVKVFFSGIPAYPKDPAHALREITLKHVSRSTRKPKNIEFYSMIRAWNKFRAGETSEKWMSPRVGEVVAVDGLRRNQI